MNAAKLERSERLKRVLEVLRSAPNKQATSLQIQEAAHTVAPATCVSELRHQGHEIDCQIGVVNGRRLWTYRLIETGQRMLFAGLLLLVPWSLFAV